MLARRRKRRLRSSRNPLHPHRRNEADNLWHRIQSTGYSQAGNPLRPPSPQRKATSFIRCWSGEGVTEHFLEVRFRTGMRTCFSYSDLIWFNYDPEGGFMDLEFGGYLVTVKGRGLGEYYSTTSGKSGWHG